MNEEQVKQQEDKGKEAKKFNDYFRKLTALLNGDSLLKKRPKVGKEDFSVAMAELVKEEKEALTLTVKSKIKALVQEKMKFDEFLVAEKKKFEKVVEEQQKEFNKKAEEVFSMIDGIEEMEKRYYDTFKNAADTPSDATPQ